MKSLTALAPANAAHARDRPKRQRRRVRGRLDDWTARIATARLDAIAHATIGRANAGVSRLHALTARLDARATVVPVQQRTPQDTAVAE